MNHREALCVYDPINPDFIEPLDGDEPRTPRENCFCDNCFHGRDALAQEIEALKTQLIKGEQQP